MKQQNTVELLGYYGGDVEHACSAWTSTSRDLTPDKRERIPRLLKDLASNGHETPFEKSMLHFLVDTEIASHIHILKHRIGVSVNAESARYKELREDKFYVPEEFFEIPVDAEGWEGYSNWGEVLTNQSIQANRLYHACLHDVSQTLGRKRAKESARFFKMYNSIIESDVAFNFRSFVHFQQLRNSPHAQAEIRHVAQQMLDLVRNIPHAPFEHSLHAFELC